MYLSQQIKNGLSVSVQLQDNFCDYCQIKFYKNWDINNLISATKISTTLIKNLNNERLKEKDDEPLSLLFLDFLDTENNTKNKNNKDRIDKPKDLEDNFERYIKQSEKALILPLTSLIVSCKSKYLFTDQIEEVIKARYEWDSLEIVDTREEALKFIAMG